MNVNKDWDKVKNPWLFDLITDGFSKIIQRGREAGVLKGIGANLREGQSIFNLNYADDTLIFLNLWNFKYAGREKLSGLKINFEKEELIGINISDEIQTKSAHILNCKIGTLPITYLGFPLHRKLPNQ